MISFIEHIANQYEVKDSKSLKDTCFVFPSRRACIYFNDILQQQNSDKVFWSPTVLSIEEFIQQNCPDLTVVDNIQLLFKLYRVYTKNATPMAFDVFYNWGLTLLKDFDEIDRYLVDSNLLYKNLQGIEDIEATFGHSEDVLAAVKGFQEVINTSQDGNIYSQFQKTWSLIGKVLPIFKEELIKNRWAYNGMCYRWLAENLKEGTANIPYTEVVFCGFNAISRAEEQIMEVLLEQGKAKLYFDTDKFYLENEKQEAGHFLRKHKKKWRNNKSVHWVITNGFSTAKQINIIGLEQKSSLAKAAVQVIKESQTSFEKTAMLLADETLLAPVLYALPEEVSDVNITMGYPTAGTPIADLTHSYLVYQAGITTTKTNKIFIKREAFRELINQPNLANYLTPDILKQSAGQSGYLSIELVEKLLDDDDNPNLVILRDLLYPAKNHIDAIDKLISYIIAAYYKEQDNEIEAVLENGVRYTVLKYLQDLKIILEDSSLEIDYLVLARLVRESFKQISTPFSGEPLASLQIMGFLESRALDFENIVVLSINEDLLPANSASTTYIPFGIRKAFRMPTFLEQNSIYAYHFYRILQRAKNISLLYSTQLSVTGAGEQSRFILQLINEFAGEDSTVMINQTSIRPYVPPLEPEVEISVVKTPEVIDQLTKHFEMFTKERSLSPTSLSDYITCSLKYYYSRVLRIKEPEEESDKVDARVFGNILHDVIERVYASKIGKKISPEDILILIKETLPIVIEDSFAPFDKQAGEIAFTKRIIHKLATRILKNDAKDAPITIIDLESKHLKPEASLLVNENLTLKLGGYIDRLDRINIGSDDVYRVLDYKTGKAELKSPKSYNKPIPDEDYIKAYFQDPKYKSGFQILYYLLILKQMNPNWQVNGGIIGIKNLNNGVAYLRSNKKPISHDIINLFEGELKVLINEILDETVPFKQTDDIKRCTYCQFKRICART